MYSHSGALLVFTIILLSAAPVFAEKESDREGEAHDQGVELNLDALRPHGVTIGKVERRQLRNTLRATAEVRFNETRRVVLAARSGGWAEKVTVFANQRVKKNQLLAEIYSPEFLSVQNEYLLILDRAGRGNGTAPENRSLLDDGKQRLRILGLTDEEIARLAKTRKTYPFQHVHSPINGAVIQHKLNTGDTIEPGQMLYVIAGLRTVWAEIAITEADLATVRGDQPVTLSVKAYPDDRFTGRILSLGADMDEATRTVKARALIENPRRLLRPGMFAEAEIQVGGGQPLLAVPRAAVVLIKGVQTVFRVASDELHPQPVKIGVTRSGWTEIKTGVTEGDEIAVKGLFMLKAMMLKSEFGEGGH
ncbi:MAG TPA: efflux RND transporter periplasmic adaptor subunit [Actinobacteria bacterium]|nr:efflux RND transporter periplasmic adaptor subunit [Actinomycetota bacterium]